MKSVLHSAPAWLKKLVGRGLPTLLAAVMLLASQSPVAQEVAAGRNGSSGPVKASLVAANSALAPGEPILIAVRLEHAPGWSTFWSNPGDGQPTEVSWRLANGWSAGPIKWPVPKIVRGDGGAIQGQGFDGTILLASPLTPGAGLKAGQKAVIAAHVRWYACNKARCVPGEADLQLALPVVSANPPADRVIVGALAATPMPESGAGVTVGARREGDTIILTGSGLDGRDLHFYSATDLVWYDAPQAFVRRPDGKTEVRLAVDPFYEGAPDAIAGVLAFTDARGRYRGIHIDQPLGAQPQGKAASASPASGERLSAAAYASVLLAAFLGGLILNLMPCVLPVLSLKALALANNAGRDKRAVRSDGLAYTAGIILSFVAIAGLMLLLRSGADGIGWGFHLQNPAIVLLLALVMMAVGFNLVGLFEVGMSVQGLGQGLIAGDTLATSFLTGVLAVVVAAPCTAPFMASALGAAVVQPPLMAIGIFVLLGFGLAFPYLLLALVPGAKRLLPRPGAWMLVLRQFLAFPMFATAAWLLWVMAGQSGQQGLAIGLASAVALAFAAWAYGREGKVFKLAALSALALVAAILVFSPPVSGGPARSDRESEAAALAYSPHKLDALLAEGRPVFAYFTADWCLTCKVNERVALDQDETRRFFASRKIAVMVGDWTRQDPRITEILSRYGRAGVPMYVYFPAGSTAREGVVLPQILTPAIVKNNIEKIGR